METGLGGELATMDDWRLHLTTLFPEVRLKGYIEFRSADSQPPARVVALPALIKGVFHDADCLEAADDLVKRWGFEHVAEALRDVTRGGMKVRLLGIPLLELARELFAIAEEGLRRQAALDDEGRDERIYLESLRDILSSGRSPADLTIASWSRTPEQRMARLVAENSFPNAHLP